MFSKIVAQIEKNVPNSKAHILDPMNDGAHLQSIVISSSFGGKSRLQCHRMVLESIEAELSSNVIHAMSIKTFTPEKWDEVKDDWQLN